MPELPEVETTRSGIAPHIEGQRITGVIIRQPRLRWLIPNDLAQHLKGRKIQSVERRAKYLLLNLSNGTLIMHLGMSGSLRILPRATEPGKHDHFDLQFKTCCLRFHDPRRFGAVLWTDQSVADHPLISHLGPEPLSADFTGAYLHQQAQGRHVAVKNLIMDGKVVVGVGNIYANEALFRSRILPSRAANRISAARYLQLADEIKQVLAAAIKRGGTTLRDFQQEDGKPGYFAQELLVYGKAGEPCPGCGEPLKQKRIGQRSSFYCGKCQR
ncbi:MAG: bifunctional DNA-formamidopyrimidine glycosylase/DNA-(apurinic or apyrimidinic site) lyase [Sedimenticola sp.]|uniref:Formamidopyrimidine-DNA glycosylase n=1 Tax=Sedimenticola thiotaurini TaxID=1543721 RepID=A0A558DC88_9GAMM|nr:bifunctional DNA-formamidopyrimidine glycosylase/DNA-(apurinic or apyrimidinic site) lyase [Sedimenticola sp.]MCW8948155.1 bifunctional DNA-formamidopyrimidine glycosylase/DNA-(apurinic or apyrimidinic site) lyase [Sedimenticola sp.]MCW8948508.1 bifunctional DNA-formamidopyrimidine glycosylase/DNA-(apurinic or apyrimidinic site) lyase [Sedimenticola sp.]MCW8975344.1 bifunctional DNA-formamidopyrimidine glycosylase/DNA-(apurinic or apyrimidinic site) lyase [Sedimenticola sp.]TVT58630.1 MAG: b